MASTVSKSSSAPEVSKLDNVRPAMAKVVPESPAAGPTVSAVLYDAVLRYYGTVKSAEFALGIDRSQMRREFEVGKIACLDKCDATGKAFIAKALYEAFGGDPKAYARHVVRNAHAAIDALAEIVEVA